ncbi:hypothetical protein DFJ74DRAFT_651396 [Hyaloraphidium curvatum]|nr:hypothetical protein DFJ74DRAFT_651396 [Hyaloraphidium curvatum]
MDYTHNDTEAEAHLARAAQVCNSLNDLENYYEVILLQCHLLAQVQGVGAAEKLVRSTIADLVKLERYDLYYRFALTATDIFARSTEAKKCLLFLDGVIGDAERRGDTAMRAVLLLSKAGVALRTGGAAVAKSALEQCATLLAFGHGTEDEALGAPGSFPAPGAVSEDEPAATRELRLSLAMSASVMLMRMGETSSAREWLCGPHGMEKMLEMESSRPAEQRSFIEVKFHLHRTMSVWSPYPSMQIPVKGSDGDAHRHVPVPALPRTHLHCMTWLLLGIVRKADDPIASRNYLTEGLKLIDRALRNLAEPRPASPMQVRSSWTWLMNCKVQSLLNLSDVLLVGSRPADAEKYLSMATHIMARNAALMDRWRQALFLAWGLLRRSTGEFEDAIKWLEAAAEPAMPDRDIRHVALLNMGLIYTGPECEDVTKMNAIWRYLEDDLRKMEDANLRATVTSCSVAQSAGFLQRGEFQKAKALWSDGLRDCDVLESVQLQAMILSLSGAFFSSDRDSSKAEQLLQMALKLAERTGSDILAATCAAGVRDLLLRKKGCGSEADDMGKRAEELWTAYVRKNA